MALLWEACWQDVSCGDERRFDIHLALLVQLIRDDLGDPLMAIWVSRVFKRVESGDERGAMTASEEVSKCYAALGCDAPSSESLIAFYQRGLRRAS